MSERKKLVFFITHSVGELDVVLPIICRLISSGEKYEVTVCFLVKKLFDQYLNEEQYRYMFKLMTIQFCFIQMPNKFDYKNKRENNLSNMVLRLKRNVINPLSLIKVYFILHGVERVFHEYSCQIKTLKFIYLFSRLFRKNLYTYSHGHACCINTNIKKIHFCTKYSHFLNFHEHSELTFINAGYVNQSIIGYPKFYPEWKNFVLENFSQNFYKEKYILIYSRPVSPYYMSEDLYKELLIETFSAIYECFGSETLVVIKTHPREDAELIHKLLANSNIKYVISQKESSVLSLHARLAVSFWTSAILSSVAFGVPSIEFYKESSSFHEIEPLGSSYKNIGLKSAKTKQELIVFIRQVLLNNYSPPLDALDILKKGSSVNFAEVFNQGSR